MVDSTDFFPGLLVRGYHASGLIRLDANHSLCQIASSEALWESPEPRDGIR